MSAVDLMSFDHEIAWRPWAVAYFLLIGTAAGAGLLMVCTRLLLKQAAQGALVVAASFALASGLPLLADLHQPARFLHFYMGTSTSSIMWWGSWILPLFIASLLLLALLRGMRMGQELSGLEQMLTAVSGLLALCILGYTAGEMHAVAARPLWASIGFPITLTLSALMSGAGATIAYDHLRGVSGPGRGMLVISGAVTLIAFGIWLLNDPDLSRVAADQAPVTIYLVFIGAGLVYPMLMIAITKSNCLLSVSSGVAAVLGALAFRWATFMGAQLTSKTETAMYDEIHLDTHEVLQVFLGSAGMLVLCLIVLSVFLRVLANRTNAQTQA